MDDEGDKMTAAPCATAISLTRRLLLVATLGALPVLGLCGGLLLWLFGDRIQQQFDSYLTTFQQELIANAAVDQDGRFKLAMVPGDPRFSLPFSGWYWQIVADGRVIAQSESAGPTDNAQPGSQLGAALPPPAPLVPDDEESISPTQAPRGLDIVAPDHVRLRAIATDIRFPGSNLVYCVIVAGPRMEIDRQVNSFGLQLASILGALGVAFLIATLLQIRFGLAPLRRLHRAIQEIRLGSLHRLPSDYPAEVAPVVDELNEVLKHNAALIDRARSQAGNLAHALKTPLSVMRHELPGIGGTRGARLQEQLAIVTRQIDRMLARIRTAGPAGAANTRVVIAPIAADVVFSMRLLHRARNVSIEADVPADLGFIGDAADLTEMLGNLLDNACKWASSRVTLQARLQDNAVTLSIDDDGPGIPATQRDAALRRGQRLDETMPGSGLGLDIVRETAELYRGSLRLGVSPTGGLRAELTLPGEITARPQPATAAEV